MLYRLIESWIKRMPLPTGTGRTGVLLVWMLLTGASLGLGVPKLTVAPLADIFDAADPGEQRYAAYKKQFSSDHEAFVLIDTGSGGEHEPLSVEAAFALGESLEQERKIAAVHWGLNPTTVSPKLIRTLPLEDFASQTAKLKHLQPLLESETPTALLQAGMAQAMRGALPIGNPSEEVKTESPSLAEGAAVFMGLMEAFTLRMETPAAEATDLWSAMQDAAGVPRWELLRTASERLLVLRVELSEGVDDQMGYAGSLAALRRQVEAVRLRFEDLEIGVTGFEPVRAEAEEVMRRAAMRAAGGSVIGLMLLAGLAWRSVWLPVVVVVLPSTAVTWTLGGVSLWYGEVNALAFVGVLTTGLIALFGGLWLAAIWARGESRRTAFDAVAPVLAVAGLAVSGVGGWLILGGDGSLGWLAVDAATPGLSGLREAGVMAVFGAAVGWCMVVILGPALLRERRDMGDAKREARGELARAVADAAGRRPGLAWVVAGVMMASVVVMAMRTPNTVDTSGFLPAEIEGAVWQERAMVQGGEWGMPVSYLVEGMEAATALTARLRALPEVAAVTGIGRLIPTDGATKLSLLEELESTLGPAARRAEAAFNNVEAKPPTGSAALINQIQLIRSGLEILPGSVKEQLGELEVELKNSADTFLDTARQLNSDTQAARLAALQQDYAAARQQAGTLITGILDPSPLSLADLSTADGLFDSWIHLTHDEMTGESKTVFRLKVYPKASVSGWPSENELAGFHDAVRSVDAEPTGTLDRLLARGGVITNVMKSLVILGALAMLLTLAACGVGWRAWLGATLSLAGSAFVLVAAVGWMSQPMTTLAWSVWPVVGTVGLLWSMTRALGNRRDHPQASVSEAAGGEAFGLMLAAAFVVAAGLRSAGAPGLTATAVAACLAVGLLGVWVLLLVQPRRHKTNET